MHYYLLRTISLLLRENDFNLIRKIKLSPDFCSRSHRKKRWREIKHLILEETSQYFYGKSPNELYAEEFERCLIEVENIIAGEDLLKLWRINWKEYESGRDKGPNKHCLKQFQNGKTNAENTGTTSSS